MRHATVMVDDAAVRGSMTTTRTFEGLPDVCTSIAIRYTCVHDAEGSLIAAGVQSHLALLLVRKHFAGKTVG